MDMLEMPVRIVVKAPNQQIEDQMVECALDWTVKKLKAYLSETYPSKPKAEQQKLIYSGQLLHDHLRLKDFLRQYEAEKVHTVHLVCVPPPDVPGTKAAARNPPVSQQSPLSERVSSNLPCPQSSSGESSQNDGLRCRTSNSEQFHHVPQPYVGGSPHPYSMPQQIPADVMAQQMAWFQQMYMQYMHMCMPQFQGMSVYSTQQAQPENHSPATSQTPPPEPVANENEAVERRPPNNVRLNAQGVVEDDDDDGPGNWDWLDWFYALSRAAVLFSIVYFYSSFSRFALVMLFAGFMYFFRRQAHRNRRPPNNGPRVRAADAQPRPEAQENGQGEDQGGNEAEQMQREIREIVDLMNHDMEDTNEAPQNQGLFPLNAFWTFVTTFFSSLFPEQPDQLI